MRSRRVRVRQSERDRFLEEGPRKPAAPEWFAALVGPFRTQEAAEARRSEHGLDTSSVPGRVVPSAPSADT
jgi:hypothetical protein